MRLSSFSVLDAYAPPEGAGGERYGEFLRLAAASERAGLYGIWVAEHHFHAGGVCPSPSVLLAAASQRTERLRLGSLVCVLPFHDPISVAEEFALVDQLSGGRLRLGVGSGYIPLEFAGFGVEPKHKRECFDRSLATLRAALEGRTVRSTRGPTLPVRLNVRPVQRPHPPLWVAVQRPEAIPHVAAQGLSIAILPYATVEELDELPELIARYRRALPPGSPAQVGVAVHIYVGSDPEGAEQALQRYLDTRMASRSPFLRDHLRVPPRHPRAADLRERGFALFGSEERVASGLEAYRRAGVDELLGIFDFGGLSPREVERSVAGTAACFPECRSALPEETPATPLRGPLERTGRRAVVVTS